MKKSNIAGCFAWMNCWSCTALYVALWLGIVLSMQKENMESVWIKLLTLGLIVVFYRGYLSQQMQSQSPQDNSD